MKQSRFHTVLMSSVLLCCIHCSCWAAHETVKAALIYPETGSFFKEGKDPWRDMWRAAQLAQSQINASGGILDKSLELKTYDSNSSISMATKKALQAIDKDGAKMIFGVVSSDVAIALSKLCEKKKIIFFAAAATSTDLTSTHAGRYTFRECGDNWMAANALKIFLRKHFSGKKYFYITSDNTWGWTIEAAVRKVSQTQSRASHPGLMVAEGSGSYHGALIEAARQKPDVLIISLCGEDEANALQAAEKMELKKQMQIIVPNLTIGTAELASPRAMEGIVGTVSWYWRIPYGRNYKRGIQFVKDFVQRHQRYPSSAAASAFTILHEYKAAVERAGTVEPLSVVRSLENHTYQLAKDKQTWRKFDHQSNQTIYLVRCKPAKNVILKQNMDYFLIINHFLGKKTILTQEQWNKIQEMAGGVAQ